MYLRKEIFPTHRHSNLNPRGDGLFQVLKHIKDNAYKIDLPGDYIVSATFNVSYLSLFYVGSYLRTNLFEEGGNDEQGPIIRARAKKLQEALNGLVIWPNPAFKEEPKLNQAFEGIGANKEVQKSINIIIAIDGNNSHDFGN